MSSEPKIVLHWLENSRSQRILWLLEELGLQYEVVEYKRDPVTMFAGPELKAVHPLGKSPAVTIEEDGKMITLAESGAIVEYIIERFGKGQLSPGVLDNAQRSQYLYWLHWAEGTAMLPLMLCIVFGRIKRSSPWYVSAIVDGIVGKVMAGYVNPKLSSNFAFVEAELEGKQFFLGDTLSGADIMMSYPCEGLESALGFGNFPNIAAWVARIKALPSWERAMEKGGPASLEKFLNGVK